MRLHIDWNRSNTWGIVRVGPPPLWLILLVIAILAVVLGLSLGR